MRSLGQAVGLVVRATHEGVGENKSIRFVTYADGAHIREEREPRKISLRERFRYWRASKWSALGEHIYIASDRLGEFLRELSRKASDRADRLWGFDD